MRKRHVFVIPAEAGTHLVPRIEAEDGKEMDPRFRRDDGRLRKERGFTLIEMLVALAVFSLAALALLRLQGFTLSSTADLDQKLLGQIVARNLAVELLSDPAPPSLGEAQGQVENAGQSWRWTREAKMTDDPRIMQIDLRVDGPLGRSPNVLTIVRPAK